MFLDPLRALPRLRLWTHPSAIEELPRLRRALGGRGPRLLIKRDDLLPFGAGGNKIRKLDLVGARARAEDADLLITCGGLQSNHARATAAVAARLGIGCTLVLNGTPPARPTGNALLSHLYGASLAFVDSRDARAPKMAAVAEAAAAAGRRPFVVPLGASVPLGVAAFVQAIGELLDQGLIPDVIIHASSSAGTQAGLVAGCQIHDLGTRVIGVSADEPAASLEAQVRDLIDAFAREFAAPGIDAAEAPASPEGWSVDPAAVRVDDRFIGGGYGVPTPASQEAQDLFARHEAILVDHTYTAKAAAALLAYVRQGELTADQTVLFWHTGGQIGLFA